MKFSECMNRLGTETAFGVLAKAKALEAEGREINLVSDFLNQKELFLIQYLCYH